MRYHHFLVALAAIIVAWPAAAQPPVSQTPELLTPPPEVPPLQPPPLFQPSRVETFPVEPSRRFLTGPGGWIANLELSYVFAEIPTRVHGQDGLFGRRTDFCLDQNVAPTFNVGYAFPDTMTSIFASYRYLGTDGAIHDDPTPNRARLDVNDFSLYARRSFELGSGRYQGALEAGVRMASIYYDLTYIADLGPPDSVDVEHFELHGSNRFFGAGPSVGVTGDWEIVPGLSLFGHTDFAALFGRATFKSSVESDIGPTTLFDASSQHRTQTVKALRSEIGLNWAPRSTPHMQFQFGYTFEYLWDIGRFGDASDDLMLNGIFGRLRVNF